MTVISLPNAIIFDEVRTRVSRGEHMTIPLKGTSMEPTLHDLACNVGLAPLEREPRIGDVVLATHNGHDLLHRIIKIDGDDITLQGDNCYSTEQIRRTDIYAILTQVYYHNGHRVSCDSREWKRISRRSLIRKKSRNILIGCLGREGRKKLRPWYFFFLAILMWAPLNGLADQFPNYVMGLRADHFVHASIYIFCAPFLMDLILRKDKSQWVRAAFSILLWLACAAVGVFTESVQYLIPYRGFDVNDIAANLSGATLGWVLAMVNLHRSSKRSPAK